MNNPKLKILLKKTVSLLSAIRGYNILVLITAQYLAAIFIFSEKKLLKPVIFDWHLFFLVISTVCVVAAGYIINNFYDINADKINRPLKYSLDSYVKQETKLTLYFFLNFVGFYFGWLVSWRAAFFFAFYIFSIWFYSHKLKKHALTGLITSTTLTLLPFFVIFIHYKNFSKVIFIHAFFLLFIISVRELIKDLENMSGAIVNGYNTFPVVYGEKKTKQLITLFLVLTLIPITLLFNYPAIEYMKYYFYFAGSILIFIGIFLWKSTTKKQYTILHTVLKILLLVGVFSLLFIDKTLLIDKVIVKI